MKRILIIFFILIVTIISFILIQNKNNEYSDVISYDGKKYIYLEYNNDIFTYNFNSVGYFEIDKVAPVKHDKWDVVYFDDDIFVLDSQVKQAKKYYSLDKNYEWYFILDKEDTELEYPISINDKELKYIYGMDNMKKNKSILFEDIKKMGTLKKTSKDGFVSAIISLALYEDDWYWRTEIIDDTKNGDPEYVILLPKTLNKKINDLINKN